MLYHVEVFWPGIIKRQLPTNTAMLVATEHAKNAARNDRYGIIPLPKMVNFGGVQFIEAEIDEKRTLTKIVIRIPHSADKDIVMALMPIKGGWLIKTVWYNLNSDNHKTLNKSRYVKG